MVDREIGWVSICLVLAQRLVDHSRSPMHALLNGSTVDAASLGVNDSLNFGRFDRVEGLNYEIRLALAELSARMEVPWDQLIHELRDDDRRDGKSSALERMNYPTFKAAFAYPNELREVIETFLVVEILRAFVPFSPQSRFIVNSVDTVSVASDGLAISGRCFKRRLP